MDGMLNGASRNVGTKVDHHADVDRRSPATVRVRRERVACAAEAAGPALLELVDDDDEPSSCAATAVTASARTVAEVGGRRHLRERSAHADDRILARNHRDDPSRHAALRATSKPARSTELLPEPDRPTTAVNGCVGHGHGQPSVTAPRPKNVPTRPLRTPGGRGTGWRRPCAATRRPAQPAGRGRRVRLQRRQHALRATYRTAPRQHQLGGGVEAAARLGGLGEHGIDGSRHPTAQPRRLGRRPVGTIVAAGAAHSSSQSNRARSATSARGGRLHRRRHHRPPPTRSRQVALPASSSRTFGRPHVAVHHPRGVGADERPPICSSSRLTWPTTTGRR